MEVHSPDCFDWQEIDALILAGKNITAMRMYRAGRDVALRSAYEAINERIDVLLAQSRERLDIYQQEAEDHS